MKEYYFLFAIALVYSLVASIGDIKKREVPNWLNFSFVAFALAYKAFYALLFNNFKFFFFGILGFILFFIIANAFYYTKVFAGGDAKLLMGFGIILPFENYADLFFLSIEFILLLFLVGAVYSLIYSLFLVHQNYKGFRKEFLIIFKQKKYLFLLSLVLILILLAESLSINVNINLWLAFSLLLLLVPLIYIYLKSVEKVCFIKFVSPQELTEGDWLERDVKIKNKIIEKSVHGLSYEEIALLKKYGKKVWIKYGVPFVPAFLIALLIMVFFWVVLKSDLFGLFGFLF